MHQIAKCIRLLNASDCFSAGVNIPQAVIVAMKGCFINQH